MPSFRRLTAATLILLAGGVLVVFVLLGTLQWFNTSKVDFLNPETYGQTILSLRSKACSSCSCSCCWFCSSAPFSKFM